MWKSFAALLLAASVSAAPAVVRGDGIPSPEHSLVSCSLAEGQSATLLVVPDGSGPSFTAARDPGGAAVDATIRLVLKDYEGNLIPAFAVEDMWIESLDEGLVCCAGGGRADHNTDANGSTTWTAPLRAGGRSQSVCRVFMNGLPVTGGIEPMVHFNSPDLDGDLAVTLTDIGLFADVYFGDYSFAGDLYFDGAVDLGDVGVLAGAVGADCP